MVVETVECMGCGQTIGVYEPCQNCIENDNPTVMGALQMGCQIMGHDWEDDEYAGPDTAFESHECQYCYESWEVTYY